MTPGAPAAGWSTVAARIENTITALNDLRQLLHRAVDVVPPVSRLNAKLVNELHHSWIHLQINRLDVLEQLVLRPLAPNARYMDCPGNKGTDAAHGKKGDRSDAWSRVLGDYSIAPVNVIANEEFITVEYHARVIPLASSLTVKSGTFQLAREPFDLAGAFVVRTWDGYILEVDHYYDFSAVLRQLGLLPNVPMGHDEPGGQPPPLVHGAGFLKGVDLQRPAFAKPGRRAVSVGVSTSERARANVANCTAIHEAFVQHTPERFSNLIASDAIWIDVPTGVVLNGAIAAAHHDHGNWQTAFPDSDAVVDRLIANDEWVTVQHRGTGTHTGELVIGGQAFGPTGRKMAIRVLDIVRYSPTARATLIRNYYDTALMLTQLGLGIA